MKKTAIITTAIVAIFLFASLAMAGNTKTTKAGYIGAMTKANLDKVMSYISQGDDEAMNSMIKNQQAFQIKQGLKVYVESTSWGTVELRLAGQTLTFWTVREAIKD